MRRSLTILILFVERIMAPLFALFFLLLSAVLGGYALIEFLSPILRSGDFIGGLLDGLNTAVVALAVYELAQGTYDQYGQTTSLRSGVSRLRDGVVRFIGVACSALVLEALIMVIKYSQRDLAGFLYYPVAIMVGAGVLLMSLGAFTRLTEQPAAGRSQDPSVAPRESGGTPHGGYGVRAGDEQPVSLGIGEWRAPRRGMWISAGRALRGLARANKTKGLD